MIKYLKKITDKLLQLWDDNQPWNANIYMAEKILPKLIEYKKTSVDFPVSVNSQKEWDDALDAMIFSFKFILSTNYYKQKTPELSEQVQKGFELFGKHFQDFWY